MFVKTLATVPSTAPPISSLVSPAPVVGNTASLLFDGFETGDFSGLDWQVSGEDAWVVDGSKPYEGSFSAHVRTEDIFTPGNYSQLDLSINAPTAAFCRFYFFAPVIVPFESLQLLVDGQFLSELTTMDDQWVEGGAMLIAGDHTVSWRLTKNPSIVPDDLLAGMVAPPFRIGEAWIDNVELIPATLPFVETFESGAFTQNSWSLTGDSQWSITDSAQHEGTFSATARTDEIAADTGKSDLSIDIVTELGGSLGFQILASVSDPFDLVNVLIDNIAVLTLSTVSSDWSQQAVDIQPGKRKVTFQLVKNPGGLPPEQYSTLPPVDGRLGQVWLDEVVFAPKSPMRSFRLFSHHKSSFER